MRTPGRPSTEMALRGGALRLNLLASSRPFHKLAASVGVRPLSENVSSRPAAPRAPEAAADHLIYTQEHFALKASLGKVRERRSMAPTSPVKTRRESAVFPRGQLDILISIQRN